MTIEWQHRPRYTEGDVNLIDAWVMFDGGRPEGAIYLKRDGRWHLFYFRFRDMAWDTLEEARATCMALYRLGHYDQWDIRN